MTIVEDDAFEPDETFTVHLSNASPGAKLMLNSVLVIIVDDHLPGQLSFPQRFFTVKESQQCATVPVTRTYGSNGRVSVTFETSDGVALAGKDYVAQRGESTALPLSHSFSHTNLKSPRAEQAAWSSRTERPRRRSKLRS